jgi:hypothetical protein
VHATLDDESKINGDFYPCRFQWSSTPPFFENLHSISMAREGAPGQVRRPGPRPTLL